MKLTYREDISNMNWITDSKGSSSLLQHFPDALQLEKYLSLYKRAYELVIVSPDEITAENVNSLIYSARLLCNPQFDFKENTLIELNETDELVKIGGRFSECFVQKAICSNMILACLIAAHASNADLEYALEKYKFSLSLDWFTPHSAHPYYGHVFYTGLESNKSNVNKIYAFLCTYSIIEELGVDIRSSSKKPRFLNNEWNPEVLNDIKLRLNKIGLDFDTKMEWLIRGKPNPLYDEIKQKFTTKSQYYNPANYVYDLELKIYEAIHYCSYIRSFYLAHKTDKTVKYINPYDIHNIQSLVRILILSATGFWSGMDNYREKLQSVKETGV
ncbi:hypothetical protein SDC9_134905 [bioreactor metagenome]|uniref:Uncharacterized protein n=1 Tax=bioreactor metagenome TaxID=1076179 RepID=A0A645DF13_9ZZZZ